MFVVSYGQHRIGIARAHGVDEAATLVASLFAGELEPEELKVREATPDEAIAYGQLLGPDDQVAGVLL